MFTKLLTLSALFMYCNSGPIKNEIVSDKQNITKREANVEDSFPDWVPFKNKHGDELGEFIQVQKKSKVKKRLAPPVNFIMRAVAEEGDEYYDKGAGESDSDDYFEKKDWSDLHRPVSEDKSKVAVNHTVLSDIDGVVEIIKKGPPEPIAVALESANKEIAERRIQRQKVLEGEDIETDDDATPSSTETQPQSKRSKDSNEDGGDDDEDNAEKPKQTSEEIRESEARKAKILSSVDELKERHAEEQRQISDRLKEEDLYKDQHPNGKPLEGSFEEEPERRYRLRARKPTTKPDYDEYEDSNGSLDDKYKINVLKTVTPTEPTHRIRTTLETTSLPKVTKQYRSGKLSVFKNPSLYMVYEDDDEPTTESNTIPSTRGSIRFSARYTTTPASIADDDRISLVPADSKEGEPTLFFPKKRKNRRKRIRMTTTPSEIDSYVAETVTDNYKQTTSFDVTAADTVQRDTTAPESSEITSGTETTATDNNYQSDSIISEVVTDAVPASSDQKKEEHKDHHHKKGGGHEHHSEHSEEHEEHGKKAYEGHHEDTKTAKGHHDKENHLGKYDDHGGVDKHHSEESGHYGDHHHEEHGKKHAKYEESGKHSKGHSTKGSHDIHKKDEYEKKVEFFEEEGDSAEEEKHGGYNHEKEHSEGGHFKTGSLKANHEDRAKGESGHFERGGHGNVNKGHKQAGGHDSHGKHAHKHIHKDGKEGGRKWIYHHGQPAKTANLVVIDRRADQYYHGPHYYG